MKQLKSAADAFNSWFDTKGVRTYSSNHGNAEGHREYMAAAFLDGYNLALIDAMQLLSDNDPTKNN